MLWFAQDTFTGAGLLGCNKRREALVPDSFPVSGEETVGMSVCSVVFSRACYFGKLYLSQFPMII